MTEQKTPDPGRQSRGPALSMMLASVFLVGSLVIASLLIYPLFQSEQLPESQATQIAIDAEETPAATIIPENPESPATADESEGDKLHVAVASMSADYDPAITNSLVEALEIALEGSSIAMPVLVKTQSLPDVVLSTGEIDRTQLDTDLLVLWEPSENALLRIYLLDSISPPLLRLQDQPQPWEAASPGNVALYTPENDTQFGVDIIVSLLEVAHGDAVNAQQRVENVLSNTGGIPENRAIALFLTGLAETAQGNSIDALRDYSDAIRVLPNFGAALNNRGNLYLVLGDTPTALSAYNDVLANTPDLPGVLYNQVLASLLAEEFSTAEDDVSQLIADTASQAWNLNLRGVVRFNQGAYDAALQDFKDAAALAPETEALLFNIALTQFAAEDYAAALTTYDSLLSLAPDNVEYYVYHAQVHKATGDLEAAIELLSIVIELDDAYLEAYLDRGRLYVTLQKYDNALVDAQRALELNPQTGRAQHIVGDVLLASEDYKAARNAYNAAIDSGTVNAEVYAGRGRAQHNLLNYTGAAADYQQAIESGYADIELLYLLGFALFDAGLYEKSEDAFSAAVNAGYETADAYGGLALALDANVRRTEAEQAYAQALELDERYADDEFLSEQWSRLAVVRAVTILRRMGEIE